MNVDSRDSSRGQSQRLSHVDGAGNARMVDVSAKDASVRRARASATVRLSAVADQRFREGNLPKGSPVEVIRVAAMQAAKQTALLLPLCHPLRLTDVQVQVIDAGERAWRVEVEVTACDRTGVEMEALTAASVGALALYDMVKAVDRAASIEQVVLEEKSGGKSGHFRRAPALGDGDDH